MKIIAFVTTLLLLFACKSGVQSTGKSEDLDNPPRAEKAIGMTSITAAVTTAEKYVLENQPADTPTFGNHPNIEAIGLFAGDLLYMITVQRKTSTNQACQSKIAVDKETGTIELESSRHEKCDFPVKKWGSALSIKMAINRVNTLAFGGKIQPIHPDPRVPFPGVIDDGKTVVMTNYYFYRDDEEYLGSKGKHQFTFTELPTKERLRERLTVITICDRENAGAKNGDQDCR